MMKKINEFICLMAATAFGLGLSPIAPGTVATLLGVAIHLAVALSLPFQYQRPALIASLAIVSILQLVLTPWAQKHWNEDDPGHFVLDEVAGYLVVPIFINSGTEHLAFVAISGFFLFRILDIIKFPPAREIDQCIHDGWGILLDDIVSGLYATAIIWVFVSYVL